MGLAWAGHERHEPCLVDGMTLPRPREAETGQLPPRQPEARVPFDVHARMAEAIVANGSRLELFGVPFVLEDPARAESLVAHYRDAILLHFNERVSAPDASIWRSFADQAHDQLERHAELDASVLDVLRLTIDNL